jgi:hypothetical protein
MRRLLEHLLLEDDCVRIFGKTLFGDLSWGARDLTQEKEIRKAVQQFFSDKLTYRDKPESVVNAFRELLDNAKASFQMNFNQMSLLSIVVFG